MFYSGAPAVSGFLSSELLFFFDHFPGVAPLPSLRSYGGTGRSPSAYAQKL